LTVGYQWKNFSPRVEENFEGAKTNLRGAARSHPSLI